jgi:hypothetical protein
MPYGARFTIRAFSTFITSHIKHTYAAWTCQEMAESI